MTSVRRPLLAVLCVLAIAGAGPAHGDDACFACHGTLKDAGDAKLVVDTEAWKKTVHGDLGIDCIGCHTGHDDFPHEKSEPLAACRNCHADAAAALAASVHATAASGSPRPSCLTCHGPMHALRSADDAGSPVHPKRLAATCGGCHADPALGSEDGIRLVRPMAAYAASVHARNVAAGGNAATCSSCHGSHDIRAGGDPESHVARKNIPKTCGTATARSRRPSARASMGRPPPAASAKHRSAPTATESTGSSARPTRIRPSSRPTSHA